MKERIDELGIKNLKICQNPDYFCFGTDSVLLANFATSNNKKKTMLDLCSGSGVIPIIFSAKNTCGQIIAVELQDEMYELLDKNVKLNGLQDKISILKEDICNINKIRQKIEEKTFRNTVDIITVNPPYKQMGTGIISEGDVKYIAKHEVKCTLEDVLKTSSKLLENGGKLYIVHKPDRLVDLIAIGRKYNLEAKKVRFVHPKIGQVASLVLIEYSKCGGNEIKILPPLIEYDENNNYTSDMNKIYTIDENINL